MVSLSISTYECGLLPSIALCSELPMVVFHTHKFTAQLWRPPAKNAGTGQTVGSRRQAKVFNLQTYKFHALGDYVATIR
jgi:hypothetical protein